MTIPWSKVVSGQWLVASRNPRSDWPLVTDHWPLSPQIILNDPVIITRRYRVNVSGVVMPSPVGVAML